MASGLLSLPPELRLNVYKVVITSNLASGTPSDVAGLLFSCRTVYDEMKNDCIDKVAPLLSVAKAWAAVHLDNAQLQIYLPGDYRFIKAPNEASISIPHGWETTHRFWAEQSFKNCVAEFAPLICLPWSTLNLSVRTLRLESKFIAVENSPNLLHEIFQHLAFSTNGFLFQNTNRLTLKIVGSSTSLSNVADSTAF